MELYVRLTTNSNHLSQGNFDEAGSLCLRAISTSEKVLGHDHPELARMLQNLAISLRKQVSDAAGHYEYTLTSRAFVLPEGPEI